MKIRMRRLHLFILLCATFSLLIHSPYEVFAENEVVSSIVKINDTTDNGPTLANGYWFGGSVANIGDLDGDGVNDLAVGANLDPGGGWHKGTVHIMFMNTDGSLKKPTVEIDDDTANGPELSDNDRFGAPLQT